MLLYELQTAPGRRDEPIYPGVRHGQPSWVTTMERKMPDGVESPGSDHLQSRRNLRQLVVFHSRVCAQAGGKNNGFPPIGRQMTRKAEGSLLSTADRAGRIVVCDHEHVLGHHESV